MAQQPVRMGVKKDKALDPRSRYYIILSTILPHVKNHIHIISLLSDYQVAKHKPPQGSYAGRHKCDKPGFIKFELR